MIGVGVRGRTNKAVPPAVIEQARALRSEGCKWAHIGRVLGYTRSGIREAVARVDRRNQVAS